MSTIQFFHDLVHTADNRFTMAEAIKFLKDMIQNSDRRYKASLKGGSKRESRCKRRTTRPKEIINVDPSFLNNVMILPSASINEVPASINHMIELNNVVKTPAATNNALQALINNMIESNDVVESPAGTNNMIESSLSAGETLHHNISSSASTSVSPREEDEIEIEDEDEQLENDHSNNSDASAEYPESNSDGPVTVSSFHSFFTARVCIYFSLLYFIINS